MMICGDTTPRSRGAAGLLAAAALFGSLAGCTGAQVHSRAGIPTIVVVTRHADTDPGSGVLNATGRERAEALAALVAPMGVTAIYSPDLERNVATVEPLARLSGVEITRKPSVSVFSAGAIAEEILERHAGGVIVWVGNVSGNLQAVYGRLGGDGMGPLDYGDLHILTIPPSGPVRVEKLHYGP
ncbi:MAG TPA: histidine phosphatase family protein [Methylomirabilota bacterium]|nr:histidine phosphatase family protein [Methylomirabilota bacterium]